MNLADVHLVLFLSRAVPLAEWHARGILEREIALYKALRPHLGGLDIVTSGGPEELDYQDHLGDINILYNRWGLPPNAYSLLAPFLHRRALRAATVYKTNQLDGAWTAVIAGRIHHKPVIVRAGYPWSLNFRRVTGRNTRKGRLIHAAERFSLRRTRRITVTTERLRQHFAVDHDISPEKIAVIPNYVDTEQFRPKPGLSPEPGRVVFVGKLKSSKNLPKLLEAMSHLEEAQLTLIGAGPLRETLAEQAASLGLDVVFAGQIPNPHLPDEINRAQVFVLPSRYEGHPKALIEAMACGVAVVGTDVVGIRDVIHHEETGLLCQPSPVAIAAALERLLEDDLLRGELGQAARAYAEKAYSLDRIVEMELSTLRQVAQDGHHDR